ncbi:ferrous iron transport protein B [candidate division KSB1 bacterium]|nr:ferrous iron transport protein B [candidate division KSB1 bacterium]
MSHKKTIKIALAGNPNSGKTSIFNALTGAHQKVGNFPGVTVEKRLGHIRHENYDITIVDLPGTYSLTAQSLDEKVARDYLINETPDIVINVIDTGCLERSLYLTTQLIAMGKDVVVDLNMWDEVEKSGEIIDAEKLSQLIGAPVVTTIGSREFGVNNLLSTVINLFENGNSFHHHPPISYGPLLDDLIVDITDAIAQSGINISGTNDRWVAVKLMENDSDVWSIYRDEINQNDALKEKINHAIKHIKLTISLDPEIAFEEGRMGYVAGIVREVVKTKSVNRMQLSMLIDRFLTHPVFGYPLFLVIMWLIFNATFTFGQYPMNWIDNGIHLLQSFISGLLPAGPVSNLLSDGIIGGVGTVIVFLPNIVILFLGISLLEDSGYMARAAFLTDKPMHFLGLHGKSFIPMLMGFGCSVPAIMATRTLESHRDRILTILLLPMISCSAKLPVYILIAGAFFGVYAGHVVFSLYLFGIVTAVLIARVYLRTIIREKSTSFVMELPPYRWPTFKSVIIHMWERTKIYLKKMGSVILIASVILWFLGYFPRNNNYTRDYDLEIKQYQQLDTAGSAEKIRELERNKLSEDLEYSFIGRIGKVIEPVFQPLGFNWQMSVALLTGFAAKEVVVSTLGVLYQLGEEAEKSTQSLAVKLKNDGVTGLSAYSFLVFILLYTACVATVLAIKREIGRKWMSFSIIFQTLLAWIVSFVIFNAGKLFGL